MCQAIQEMRKEERKIGELNKAKEDAISFYKLGVEVEKIAQGVGYAVEAVKEWLRMNHKRVCSCCLHCTNSNG